MADAELWPHQLEAVEFARGRRSTLMAYGMGTGKTLAAMTIAKECGARLTLVVGPLAVLDDGWPLQFEAYDQTCEYLPLTKGTSANRAKRASEAIIRSAASRKRLAIGINYESVWQPAFASVVMRYQWDLIIADEIHRIESPSGKASRFMTRLGRQARKLVGLTGTPMPHSPMDLYAQFRFLDSSIFGTSFVAFRNRYAVMGGFQGKQVIGFQRLEELRHRMDRITIHADRSVLNRQDAVHVNRHVTLGTKARRIYDQLERDLVAAIDDDSITAANGLVKLLRLQQLTGGHLTPDDKDEPVEVDTAKFDSLVDLLEDIPPDEPVVVFCQFRADLDTVHAAARKLKRESAELSGRRKELNIWKGRYSKRVILAVQIQTGGVGVDLTRARIGVYLSTGYSLGDYEQSLARIDRPGQERSVAFYHIIARNTVDEKVRKALAGKANVVDSVISSLSNRATKRI